jgi:hypothetical protein
MPALVKTILTAVVVLAALAAQTGQAANAAADAPIVLKVSLFGADARSKSFLDHARTTYAEEPSYSVPATFPGPLVAAPRREPDTLWMLAACFGLLLYLGYRRGNALGLAGGM